MSFRSRTRRKSVTAAQSFSAELVADQLLRPVAPRVKHVADRDDLCIFLLEQETKISIHTVLTHSDAAHAYTFGRRHHAGRQDRGESETGRGSGRRTQKVTSRLMGHG